MKNANISRLHKERAVFGFGCRVFLDFHFPHTGEMTFIKDPNAFRDLLFKFELMGKLQFLTITKETKRSLDSDFKCNTKVTVVGTDSRIKHLAFRSQVFFLAGGSTHLEPCVSPDH